MEKKYSLPFQGIFAAMLLTPEEELIIEAVTAP